MLDHPETERTDPHEEDVGRVWRDSGRVYGAGRIKAALEHERIVMSSRRINRIMKAGAWRARIRWPGPEHPRPRIRWLRPARAVAGAPLSGMNRANSLRLLRSTCVSIQRLDGAEPTAVSDS